MGIESSHQWTSGEPPSQPCPTLESPTDPSDADANTHPRGIWVDSEEDSSSEEEEEEVMEEEEEIAVTPEMEARLYAEFRATRARLMPAVTLAESCKKFGYHPPAPPFEIINHPDLFERAWGWDTILPFSVARTFSRYKEYLVDYYNRNQKKPNAAAAADLTGDDDSLTALANKCAEMEGHLMFLLKCRAGVFTENVEIKISRTSDRITKRARETTTNALESEFPAAAVAFKCITKEAELMCAMLIHAAEDHPYWFVLCNKVRLYALRFMAYKEPEYILAAAAMMGITREANLTCELVKERHKDKNGREFFSIFIRTRTLASMYYILKEYSAVGKPTRDNTAGKLISDESDVKTCPGKDVVENDILDDWIVISPKKAETIG
uniref:Uncharacterized protein n=1 Tax=Oryza rufipogon TaxID=4529 RepID=A0A0E0PE36_ORYRU